MKIGVEQKKEMKTKRIVFKKSFPVKSFLLAFPLLMPVVSYAQTGAGVSGALESVKDWIVAIANVLFVIVIVVGIIKTVTAFVQGSPNATRNLVLLVVAALVWFGFSLLIADFAGLGAIENI